MACRVPDEAALDFIFKGAERVVTVSEDEIKAAMRALLSRTPTTSPRAPGPHPLAALLRERQRMEGKRVALIPSGGNIDRPLYTSVLNGD